MRRSPTPRYMLNDSFGRLKVLAEKAHAESLKPGPHGQDSLLRHLQSALEMQIEDTRSFALSVCAEAPAVDRGRFELFIDKASVEEIERRLSSYLSRELSILGIDAAEIGLAMVQRLKAGGSLEDVVNDSFEGAPPEVNIDFNRYLALGVLREAVGLDGRVPELQDSPDLQNANLHALRLKLGAPGADIIASSGVQAPPDEAAAAAIDELRERFGSDGAGVSRDELFHIAVGSLAEETTARVELLLGDKMSSEMRSLLHAVIECAAHRTGPQIQLDHAGDSAPGFS